MNIITRISAGYILLIAIMLGLVIFQIVTINRMQSINRALSTISFQNTLTCLQAFRVLDQVEEYARKSFALADPNYRNLLKESQGDFESALVALRENAVAEEEQAELERLSDYWYSFTANLLRSRQEMLPKETALPAILQEDLERLDIQTRTVYQAMLRQMSSKVETSRNTGETAAMMFWFSAFAFLSISILVSFLILRSVSKPLAHLMEGTRAIAEGKFFYRLDTSRNDEFSQLAKDFNAMTRRLDEMDCLNKDSVSNVSQGLEAEKKSR
ncbi:MAG TPA: HAMP domain-containing protein [Acidobacteriota bacterium]|nr:HAMP domain-containing protein [Acidobacteriota bacterium]